MDFSCARHASPWTDCIVVTSDAGYPAPDVGSGERALANSQPPTRKTADTCVPFLEHYFSPCGENCSQSATEYPVNAFAHPSQGEVTRITVGPSWGRRPSRPRPRLNVQHLPFSSHGDVSNVQYTSEVDPLHHVDDGGTSNSPTLQPRGLSADPLFEKSKMEAQGSLVAPTALDDDGDSQISLRAASSNSSLHSGVQDPPKSVPHLRGHAKSSDQVLQSRHIDGQKPSEIAVRPRGYAKSCDLVSKSQPINDMRSSADFDHSMSTASGNQSPVFKSSFSPSKDLRPPPYSTNCSSQSPFILDGGAHDHAGESTVTSLEAASHPPYEWTQSGVDWLHAGGIYESLGSPEVGATVTVALEMLLISALAEEGGIESLVERGYLECFSQEHGGLSDGLPRIVVQDAHQWQADETKATGLSSNAVLEADTTDADFKASAQKTLGNASSQSLSTEAVVTQNCVNGVVQPRPSRYVNRLCETALNVMQHQELEVREQIDTSTASSQDDGRRPSNSDSKDDIHVKLDSNEVSENIVAHLPSGFAHPTSEYLSQRREEEEDDDEHLKQLTMLEPHDQKLFCTSALQGSAPEASGESLMQDSENESLRAVSVLRGVVEAPCELRQQETQFEAFSQLYASELQGEAALSSNSVPMDSAHEAAEHLCEQLLSGDAQASQELCSTSLPSLVQEDAHASNELRPQPEERAQACDQVSTPGPQGETTLSSNEGLRDSVDEISESTRAQLPSSDAPSMQYPEIEPSPISLLTDGGMHLSCESVSQREDSAEASKQLSKLKSPDDLMRLDGILDECSSDAALRNPQMEPPSSETLVLQSPRHGASQSASHTQGEIVQVHELQACDGTGPVIHSISSECDEESRKRRASLSDWYASDNANSKPWHFRTASGDYHEPSSSSKLHDSLLNWYDESGDDTHRKLQYTTDDDPKCKQDYSTLEEFIGGSVGGETGAISVQTLDHTEARRKLCDGGHELMFISAWTTGTCDVCSKDVSLAEAIGQCKQCSFEWWICADCYSVAEDFIEAPAHNVAVRADGGYDTEAEVSAICMDDPRCKGYVYHTNGRFYLLDNGPLIIPGGEKPCLKVMLKQSLQAGGGSFGVDMEPYIKRISVSMDQRTGKLDLGNTPQDHGAGVAMVQSEEKADTLQKSPIRKIGSAISSRLTGLLSPPDRRGQTF